MRQLSRARSAIGSSSAGRTPVHQRDPSFMARVSLADRGRLSWLALRRGLAHLAARIVTHPLVQRPAWLGRAERLVIAPQDLRTADPTRAAEIYGGRFAFAGKVVVCDGRSPFEMCRRRRNGPRPC